MGDADNVMGPLANGKLSLAVKGTTGPTGATSALDPAFKDFGYISEDGVTLNNDVTFKDVRAWGRRSPVKKLLDTITRGFSCSLLEWTLETIPFAFGGGAFVANTGAPGEAMYEVPAEPTYEERVAVVDWELVGGLYVIRLVYPRVTLSSLDDIALVDNDAVPIPVKVEAQYTEGLSPMLWYTNVPGLVPAGA